MTGVYVGFAGLAVVALLTLLFGRRSRRLGRAEADSENLKSAVEAARKSGAMDEEVTRLPDADLYDELHDNGRN